MVEFELYNVPTMVEGVGDEIIYGIAVLVGLALLIISYLYSNRNNLNGQGIHPDSASTVSQARQDLQDHNLRQATPPVRGRVTNRDPTCPICLTDIQFCVETNCGHCFCGQCIVTYWQHSSPLHAFKCPVCRQLVTIVLFNFNDDEMATPSEVKQDITNKIRAYNRRFSGEPRPLLDYIRDLPTLLRHFLSEIFSPGGLVWMFRVRVIVLFIAALLYFISPLDIIPEAIFGILGFVDDVIILLLLTIYISMIYRQVVVARED